LPKISSQGKNFPRRFIENLFIFSFQPVEVFVDDDKLPLEGLKQYQIKVEEKDKLNKLIDLLDEIDFNQVIIFANSDQIVELICKKLKIAGFPCSFLHGKLKQEERWVKRRDSFQKLIGFTKKSCVVEF
jgi:ATP-dependent RNA helicase UAP56/SUB2